MAGLAGRDLAGLVARIGVIADVQFVDQEDGFDYTGMQRRRYRHSLEVLRRAVGHWNTLGKVALVAQLGDLIDVKNTEREGIKDAGTSEEALRKVQEVLALCDCKHVVNVIGNHELYNFSRRRLEEVVEVRRGAATWHTFLPIPGVRLRIVVVDAYQVSTIQGVTEADTAAALAFLGEHNPNDITRFGTDWSRGLAGLGRRYMPYNGMVGEEQLAWLAGTLAAAAAAGEAVILLSHVPVCPAAADPLCLLWNYPEVLQVLDSHPGTVAMVLAGHDHEGGAAEREGVWHLTLPSPLLVGEGEECWGEVEVWGDRLEWRGRGGGMPEHIVIPLPCLTL